MNGIKESVLDFILNNLFIGGQPPRITDDSSFLDLGIIDSTGVIELIAFLEETYGIHVEDEEILPENLDNLGSIERFVLGKMPMHAVSPATA